ncbi:unnamed protein product, partial [Adineta steineri]
SNGNVLVAGGTELSYNALSSAEVYDSFTGLWTTAGTMNEARLWHTASMLTNGSVLVAGGTSHNGVLLSSAELYG